MEGYWNKTALESARNAIRTIAVRHRISEKQVREEMMQAIRAGMLAPDPKSQKQWREIPWSNGEPNAEEFIAWIASKI